MRGVVARLSEEGKKKVYTKGIDARERKPDATAVKIQARCFKSLKCPGMRRGKRKKDPKLTNAANRNGRRKKRPVTTWT